MSFARLIARALARSRRQQQLLEQSSRELDAINHELSALVYSISHDLRSPLRAIDGFSEALSEDYGDRLDDEGRVYIERIRSGAKRMDQLIADMTRLAQVSRADLRRETVNISELAASIAGQLQQSEPQRIVTFAIAPDLRIEGDPALLRIAFENLLGNAWKFTSKHPTARIEVGSTRRDGHKILYVRDDGAGFDSAHSDRLFAPFQRLHSLSEFEGNGIGLAIVRRIVHRHGGEVSATGSVEKGAIVEISLE